MRVFTRRFGAGFQMDRLFSGNVEITDECVLEKLGRLDDIGDDRFRVGGSPLEPNNTFGTGGSSGGASGGSASKLCLFEFWQDGRKLWEFVAPCDSADGDKKEINP